LIAYPNGSSFGMFMKVSAEEPHLTLVNLASDGTVQWISLSRNASTENVQRFLAPRDWDQRAICVRPPFGVDNLFAITTPTEPVGLRTWLSTSRDLVNPIGFLAQVEALSRKTVTSMSVQTVPTGTPLSPWPDCDAK
jgi:hypothetical protein